jgi:NAD(P)-dependent dehydrogenase (short-subunit alcohol dehydrogenase family)
MNAHIKGCTAFVTGANQGIGKGFVEVLLDRGAAKVYAAARRPETLAPLVALDPRRIVPVALDVTDAAQRGAAAQRAQDVDLLINNAGIGGSDDPAERRFLAAGSLADARVVMETDFWAQIEMCRGFAPRLCARAEAGITPAIINILSVGALFCVVEYSSYSAAKVALAYATIGLRAELEPAGVRVHGVYTGSVDTRISARNPHAKTSPVEHAHEVLDAVERGEDDIYPALGAKEILAAVRADPVGFQRERIRRFRDNPMR